MCRDVAAVALAHTRKMHYTMAMYIMKTLKDSYHATGEKMRHKEVCETLCEIIKVEELRDKETVAESEENLLSPKRRWESIARRACNLHCAC